MKIIVVMGVSGSGKTTVGKLLAEQLGWTFVEADDFHPAENIEKMHQGIPLNDEDRRPWLEMLRSRIDDAWSRNESTVLACSALKDDYRDLLEKDHPEEVLFVYLHGSEQVIQERLAKRRGHFMNTSLLHSQLMTLEAPHDAVRVDISREPHEIVKEIRGKLSL